MCCALSALPNSHVTLPLSVTQMSGRRRRERGDGAQRAGYMDSTALRACYVAPMMRSRLCCRGAGGWGVGKKKKKENHNKKTTKCSANPAVNESGSLQQFFYALSIPQGDKHNAEPAPSATSPTPLHCKHCGLPHFMSVNPFKPTGEYSCQRGQRAFRVT